LISFFERIGLARKISESMSFTYTSNNAIPPAQTLVAFLVPVVAGARRFAHTDWLRADKALHALFFDNALLSFLEARAISYIMVARLTTTLKRKAAGLAQWTAIDANYAWARFSLKLHGWPAPREFFAIRERVRENKGAVGRCLIDVEG